MCYYFWLINPTLQGAWQTSVGCWLQEYFYELQGREPKCETKAEKIISKDKGCERLHEVTHSVQIIYPDQSSFRVQVTVERRKELNGNSWTKADSSVLLYVQKKPKKTPKTIEHDQVTLS